MIYGKQTTPPRVDTVQPDSAAAAAGFQPGDVVLSINGRAIESFTDMQRIVSISAGETLDHRGRSRRRRASRSKPCRRCKEIKDNFGNVHRLGVLGISRCRRRRTSSYEPVGPLQAVGIGVAGDLVRHRAHGLVHRRDFLRPGDRPTSLVGRSGSRRCRGRWRPRVCRRCPAYRGAFDLDRSAQSLSGAAARWGSPFVLWIEAIRGQAAVGAGAGSGISHRFRDRGDVDDLCNLQ